MRASNGMPRAERIANCPGVNSVRYWALPAGPVGQQDRNCASAIGWCWSYRVSWRKTVVARLPVHGPKAEGVNQSSLNVGILCNGMNGAIRTVDQDHLLCVCQLLEQRVHAQTKVLGADHHHLEHEQSEDVDHATQANLRVGELPDG